ARGSAPRGAGTRMLVSAVQAIGTIGGGHLEWKALATARAMLATRDATLRHEHYALGPALGQCCGGAVDLEFSLLDDSAIALWPACPPLFHLQMHGAGHVGHAIATLLTTLDVHVDWIDERDDAFAPTTTLGTPWPDTVRRAAVDGAEGEIAAALPGTFFLVLTHDHALDFRIVEAALRRDDAGFIGLIGSKSKRERFRRRLADRGMDDLRMGRLQCPVGLHGIVGKQPEVIALAVVAQLLQVAAARDAELSGDAPRLRTTA
ncbi:MAG: xanthine dehydrogenase accessory protein XdhC, partial [Betaproteobacteria bacterium]